jgi:two-component system NtrC family sensor kinase
MARPTDAETPESGRPAPDVSTEESGTAARFRELHGVAAVLVPAHGESLFVFSPRMAHPWVRHHDRSREAALRTLVRDPSDPLRRDLEQLLGSVSEPGPPGVEATPSDGGDTADALRRLGGGSALVVRWHADASPPAGFVVVRRRGRRPADAATWRAMEGAHRGLGLLGPGAPTPSGSGLLAVTLDAVSQALVVVDPEGRIQLWNRAAEHLLAWDRTHRLGTPLTTLDVRTLGGDPMVLGRPGPKESVRVRDCLVMGGDGAWVPVRVETRRLPGPAGDPPLLLTLAPFRREESDQLRSGTWDRPLEDLLLASPVPMVALDNEGRVRLWSAAAERVFGWPPGEVLGGQHPLDPPDGAELLEEMDRALLRRPWGQIETDLTRKDGTLLRVVVSGSRIRDPGGGVAGTLLSLVDVTHTHRMEEQIRQAQRMQAVGELAGGVAHDFNNILTRVTGLTEVIRLQLDEGHPALHAVEEVERTAMEAAEVADNLMAFSRQRMIRFEPLDLVATLRDMEPALRQTVSAEVRLELSLQDEPAVVRGDRGQVQQAMLNLAANAAAAMPGGGRLDVEVEARTVEPDDVRELPYPMDPGEYVALTVRDTGVGMSESTLARVFEPFFSARVAGDTFGAGRGLGLSATYGIVKQMGGYVWVESTEGEGTVFSLLFPRETVPPSPEDGAAAPLPDPGGTETILLVEDDAQVLSLLERALQRRGYTVHAARGGPEALGVFRMAEERIDVLVTDVVMPRMRGTELARRLREDRPGLPVLFITGYTDDPELRTGLLEPGQAILEKPFRPREVSRAVRELLERARESAR